MRVEHIILLIIGAILIAMAKIYTSYIFLFLGVFAMLRVFKRTIIKITNFVFKSFLKSETVIFHDDLNVPFTEANEAFPLFLYAMRNTPKEKHKKFFYVSHHKNDIYINKYKYEQDVQKNIIPYSTRIFSKANIAIIKSKKIYFSFSIGKHKNLIKKSTEKIFIQHGIVFLKVNFLKTLQKEDIDKFLVSSKQEIEIIKKNSVFNKNSDFMKSGLSRYQHLLNLKKLDLNSNKKTILYMPTFRRTIFEEKDKILPIYYTIKNFIKNTKVLTKKHNMKVNIALHHGFFLNDNETIRKIKNLKIPDNYKFLINEKLSNEVLKCCLLITDYSSIFFDFIFLEKPVIFYRGDFGKIKSYSEEEQKDFLNTANHDKHMFNIVYKEDELNKLIEKYIKKDFKLEKKIIDKCKVFYEYIKTPHKDLLKDILK